MTKHATVTDSRRLEMGFDEVGPTNKMRRILRFLTPSPFISYPILSYPILSYPILSYPIRPILP
jgi:hypothetical protein